MPYTRQSYVKANIHPEDKTLDVDNRSLNSLSSDPDGQLPLEVLRN